MYLFAFILSLFLLCISVPIFLVFGIGSSIAALVGLNLPWSVLIQVSFGALTKHVLMSDVTFFDDKNVIILCLFKTNFRPVLTEKDSHY